MSRKLIIIILSVVVIIAVSIKGAYSNEVDQAIADAGSYLQKQITDTGAFVYRVNMNPKVDMKEKYNVLRHFGTLYSLHMLADYKPGSVDFDLMKDSFGFIVEESMEDVEDDYIGMWSTDILSGNWDMDDQVKLGAVGLALVAIAPQYKRYSDIIELEELVKLGDFLIYMQKPNGGFYSKYIDEIGRSDKWTSIYYPGEAAFGLVELYKITKAQRFLDSAVKAMKYLYNERKNKGFKFIPADHWALIATSEILKVDAKVNAKTIKNIKSHANKIVKRMLVEQITNDKNPKLIGGFNNDGKTTPTATRLEGLIAYYPFIDDPTLKGTVKKSIKLGVEFLLKAQLKDKKYYGAWARSVAKVKESNRGAFRSNRRSTEIRIDYVQHALSALIGYKNLGV